VTAAVDLDDESPVRPMAVDLFTEQLCIDERLGDTGGVQQCDEVVLVRALGSRAAARIELERLLEPAEVGTTLPLAIASPSWARLSSLR
jgi:hypothetical protein